MSSEQTHAIDLLKTVEYGGCSAKLSPTELAGILDKLNFPGHPDLLVDISTHDDAGVYRINDETALIFTTDFSRQYAVILRSLVRSRQPMRSVMCLPWGEKP